MAAPVPMNGRSGRNEFRELSVSATAPVHPANAGFTSDFERFAFSSFAVTNSNTITYTTVSATNNSRGLGNNALTAFQVNATQLMRKTAILK
jgi:hypothetical protein